MFELAEGTVKINPEHLAIPAFKVIYDRDKSVKKEQSFKELSYIFFMADYKSPLFSYPDKKKSEAVLDLLKDKDFVPDDKVLSALDVYKGLIETSEMKLLQAWEGKVHDLAAWIKEVTLDTKTAAALVKTGIDMVKIVGATQTLREMVEKQITQRSHVRGNKSTSLFET